MEQSTGKETTPDLEMIDAFVAISQANAGFCRALDARDWAAFGDLLTVDFVLDASESSDDSARISGRDAAVAAVRQKLEEATTVHQIHIPEIELRGDEAHVVCAMQNEIIWAQPKNGVAAINSYGQYHQRFVREDGKWRLATLRLTRLHVDKLS